MIVFGYYQFLKLKNKHMLFILFCIDIYIQLSGLYNPKMNMKSIDKNIIYSILFFMSLALKSNNLFILAKIKLFSILAL